MSIVEIEEYKNYGRCAALSAGGFKALITVDIGPRIIFYGTRDGRNVLFEDEDGTVKNSGEYFDRNFGDGTAWYLYGGHRMWKAPEDDASYFPDNRPVSYSIGKDSVKFVQEPQINTGLQFSINVSISKNGGLTLTHAVQNIGKNAVKASLWAITAMKAGGTAYVPLSRVDTGYLPNNSFSHWPYNDLADGRLTYSGGYMLLRHDGQNVKPFKIGTLSKDGLAAYSVDGLFFIKKFPYANGAVYPDRNCNFESYTSKLFLELESLSPLYVIEPNEVAEHTEHWLVRDGFKFDPKKHGPDKLKREVNSNALRHR